MNISGCRTFHRVNKDGFKPFYFTPNIWQWNEASKIEPRPMKKSLPVSPVQHKHLCITQEILRSLLSMIIIYPERESGQVSSRLDIAVEWSIGVTVNILFLSPRISEIMCTFLSSSSGRSNRADRPHTQKLCVCRR